MIPVDGVWRTSGAVFHLTPPEGESLAETLREWDGEDLELADPLAEYLSSIVCFHLPELGAMITERSERRPELRNTDGDPLLLLRVRMRVPGIATLAHEDVEVRDDEVLWSGRPLTAQERTEQKEWAKRGSIRLAGDLLVAAGLVPELLDVTTFDPAQDLAWDR